MTGSVLETLGGVPFFNGLAPGQTIPLYPSPVSLCLVLEGADWFTVDEERFAVKVGTSFW